MAFRGRGRGGRFGGGRFGGGGGPCHAEKIKFELFPKIENLPDVQNVKEDRVSINWSYRLQMSWKLSPYNYKGVGNDTEGHESIDIERYSAKDSTKTRRKPSLSDCIKMTDEYVPAELAVRHQRGRKRVRWNQESDIQKLDIFEELEKKSKTENDKKEGDASEEDDDKVEEEEEEFSDNGDYDQNQDFDDDEDDFNMGDDNDDGPCY